MACATLKRSLDLESFNQRPTKRRRCSPFSSQSATQPLPGSTKLTVEPTPSAFSDANCTKLTPGKYSSLFFCVLIITLYYTNTHR